MQHDDVDDDVGDDVDDDVGDDVGVVIRLVRGDGHGEEQDFEKDRVALISFLSYLFLSRLRAMIIQQKKIKSPVMIIHLQMSRERM